MRSRALGTPDRVASLAALSLVVVVLGGCAGWTTNPALTLHVNSSIDRPLLVYVNGDWVGTIAAGATGAAGAHDATVPADGHGGPPWTVDGRSSSGTTLITLHVDRAPAGGGGETTTATLACGRITFTVGTPVVAPAPTAPAPGATLPPCE